MAFGADEGRQAQITALFRNHDAELQGFLTRQMRSPEQAADLKQDIFLRVLASEPGAIKDWRAYLFRIARNLLSDARRRARLETRLFAPEAANENIATSQPSAEAVVASKEELEVLRQVLAELPVHLRQALLWYRLDGLPLKEIGVRLNVSESMASRYVAQALKQCQARLGRK